MPSEVLEDATAPISVELGNSTITTSELLNMEEGDIIQLNTKLGDLLNVSIGETSELAQPGIKENKYAVRIASGKMTVTEKPLIKEEALQPMMEEPEEEKAAEETSESEETEEEQIEEVQEDENMQEERSDESEESEGSDEEENLMEEDEKEEYNMPEENIFEEEET